VLARFAFSGFGHGGNGCPQEGIHTFRIAEHLGNVCVEYDHNRRTRMGRRGQNESMVLLRSHARGNLSVMRFLAIFLRSPGEQS